MQMEATPDNLDLSKRRAASVKAALQKNSALMKAGWKLMVKVKANRLIKMILLQAKQITGEWNLSKYRTKLIQTGQ